MTLRFGVVSARQGLLSVSDDGVRLVTARNSSMGARHCAARTRSSKPSASRSSTAFGSSEGCSSTCTWPGSFRRQLYYRCRYAQEYALANQIDHPKIVYLREADVLPAIDQWLATAFAPGRIQSTIDALAAQAADPDEAA
uniref:hypothetical protein n=1 Tax=Actinomadura sp. SCN-SB TaxID=3373092 RepID=UPI0037509C8E